MFPIIAPKFRMLLVLVVSLIATVSVYWPTLRISLLKNIVDIPNARKLQNHPVPVMGGIAVFFGIIVGLAFFKTLIPATKLFPVLGAMCIVLYIGTIDDIISISAWKRFLLEILVALLIIYGNRYAIINFQGMWGIDFMPRAIATPLTVITVVGLINAVNMIDGIDGLSSAFGIMACGCLGFVSYLSRDYSMGALGFATAGALIPFFMHNVFGNKSKMFLGDGGSMVLGVILSSLVISLLNGNDGLRMFTQARGYSIIAFCLAVMSIPIADTLRVMACRVAGGRSPFAPDKTHLHHYFIMAGFSHISITMIELFMNVLVIVAWVFAWKLGASLEWQLYWVIIVAAILAWGTAAIMNAAQKKNGALYSAVKRTGEFTHRRRGPLSETFRGLADRRFEKKN